MVLHAVCSVKPRIIEFIFMIAVRYCCCCRLFFFVFFQETQGSVWGTEDAKMDGTSVMLTSRKDLSTRCDVNLKHSWTGSHQVCIDLGYLSLGTESLLLLARLMNWVGVPFRNLACLCRLTVSYLSAVEGGLWVVNFLWLVVCSQSCGVGSIFWSSLSW